MTLHGFSHFLMFEEKSYMIYYNAVSNYILKWNYIYFNTILFKFEEKKYNNKFFKMIERVFDKINKVVINLFDK